MIATLTPRRLVLIVATACAALVMLQWSGHVLTAAAAKLVASTAFLLLAWRCGAPASTYGKLILVGLALSWCGDMLLVGQSELAFLAGLSAFLLAHVAYIGAFVTHGYDRRWAFAIALPVTAAAITVMAWLGPSTPPSMAVPVNAYIIAISLMVILAGATCGKGGSWLIAAGAILFFLSDLSVAALRIVQTDVATYVVGLPFYYAGQVCLALSVAHRAGRTET